MASPATPFKPLFRLAQVALTLILMCGGSGFATALAQGGPVGLTLPKLRASNVILIGHRIDGMPFAYLDENKNPIGYGIDVCNEVVARMRVDLKQPTLRAEFVPVTAANRIEAVKSGKVDLECGLTVNNQDRRRDVAFALPYYFSGPRILTRSDSGIRDFGDLSGKRIVSAKGANAVPILKGRIERGLLSNAVVIEVANNEEAFAKLRNGEANAFVTTDNLLFAYRAGAQKPADWVVTGAPLVLEPVAPMLRKNDPEFKAAVDRAMAALMLDGVVARTYTRWFQSPIPPANIVLDIPLGPLLREQFRWPSDHTGDAAE